MPPGVKVNRELSDLVDALNRPRRGVDRHRPTR